jgi:hypothetical protein
MGKVFFKCFNCGKIYDATEDSMTLNEKLRSLIQELNKSSMQNVKNKFVFRYQLLDFVIKPCCSNMQRGWVFIHSSDLYKIKRTRKVNNYLDNNKIKQIRLMMIAEAI